MKYLFISLFLVLGACANKSGGSDPAPSSVACTPYASAYEVEYPKGNIEKSSVELCSDGLYKATSLDNLGTEFHAKTLTVLLWDRHYVGSTLIEESYLTEFAGQ